MDLTTTYSRIFLFTSYITCLLLSIVACGGDSNPADMQPPVVEVIDAWQVVKETFDESELTNMRLIVGNADGVLLSYEKGTFSENQISPIASASKWLSAAVIWRYIETGQISLYTQPQDLIPWWTSDSFDPRSQIELYELLAFTSGFNASSDDNTCIGNPTYSMEQCVQEVYQQDIDSLSGEEFHYGPEHMQIAGLMLSKFLNISFVEIFRQEMSDELGMFDTQFNPLRQDNPRVAGNVQSTPSDYAWFLQQLLNGDVVSDLDSFLSDYTDLPVQMVQTPLVAQGDWHYAQGAWIICEQAEWDDSCAEVGLITSPGALGWTPWIDRRTGYYGLIAIESYSGEVTRHTIPLMLALQKEIEKIL